ncbi:hypothetical protein AGLY_012193 [Aphis glycines]|uniref:DUF4371 domain-containing protein n=1 Tax=Aphis glycines TaxID=307491 RepID=A0A6G0TBI4_APHGL|nr:hypothetical protein AGLY_012193 [Aphis glycines]
MDKLQYPQKFRDERLLESSFKYRFFKTEINAKHFDLVQHAKSKKYQESSKVFFTSRSMASFVHITFSSLFSLLIDETTDISVLKFLGLVEMKACGADSIQKAVSDAIEQKGLGSDNASVIVGINNSVYTKLKEIIPSLIHIPCACPSIHFILKQAQYKNFYSAINDGHNHSIRGGYPLKQPLSAY